MNKKIYLIILALANQAVLQAASETGNPTLDLYEQHKAQRLQKPGVVVKQQPVVTPPAPQPIPPHVCQCPPIVPPAPIRIVHSLSQNSEYRDKLKEELQSIQNGNSDVAGLEITVMAEAKRIYEQEQSWFVRLVDRYPATTEITKSVILLLAGAYLHKINVKQ